MVFRGKQLSTVLQKHMVKKNKATGWQRTTVNRQILLSNPMTLIPGALHRVLQVWLPHTPELLVSIQGYWLFKSWFTDISFLACE